MSPHSNAIAASISASIACSITSPIPTSSNINSISSHDSISPSQQTTTISSPSHFGTHDTFEPLPGQLAPPPPPPPLPLSQLPQDNIPFINNPLSSIPPMSNTAFDNDVIMSSFQPHDSNISASVSTNTNDHTKMSTDQDPAIEKNTNSLHDSITSSRSPYPSEPSSTNSPQYNNEPSNDQIRNPDRPMRIFHMIVRPKRPVHHVRYIAQTDKDGWMVKRNKVGNRIKVFVVLDDTILTVLRNKSGPVRFRVNVRAKKVHVDISEKLLRIPIESNTKGKERIARLFVSTEKEAAEWKHALDAAVMSDISDYYSLGDSIGSGAYGDVVEGIDVRTNEKRAVKIIKKGNNKKLREHLASEMQVMKSISHPNIVQTYQIFDLKTKIYIAMEYVRGGDLFDYVSQHPNLTESQVSQMMNSIFLAVNYLHENCIVHRDLKPENILCGNNSWPLQIKVTDFGFSGFCDPDNDTTMRTQVGTPYFMAPEILTNAGHGPPVDSWSCGVILYTILTGRLPFAGRNQREYFANVRKGKPLFPKVLWKDISDDAMRLVKGLLNPIPGKRLNLLGATEHTWIKTPNAYENEVTRNRSNLHSSKRRLLKARQAIIAVAMANRFRATVPQVVEKVGESTKKVAGNIENGVKKTANNIGGGTKRVADEIGTGTKKVAGGIAEGTKKVADGIGTGVKKTVDGMENGAKKVGEGVKKTADGIEKGVRSGIEKSAKKTGEGFKRSVDSVRMNRGRDTNGSCNYSQAESGRATRKRSIFSRRPGSRSSGISESEHSPQDQGLPKDIPMTDSEKIVHEIVDDKNPNPKSSSSELYSAVDDHSEMEDGWAFHTEDMTIDEYGTRLPIDPPPIPMRQTEEPRVPTTWEKPITNDSPMRDGSRCTDEIKTTTEDDSNYTDRVEDQARREDTEGSSISAFDGSESSTERRADVTDQLEKPAPTGIGCRPNLTPLTGLTIGLSDDCMNGDEPKIESAFGENGSDQAYNLRMAAALLLASNANRPIIDSVPPADRFQE